MVVIRFVFNILKPVFVALSTLQCNVTKKWIENQTSLDLVMVTKSICLFDPFVEYVGPPDWAKAMCLLCEPAPLPIIHEVKTQTILLWMYISILGSDIHN